MVLLVVILLVIGFGGLVFYGVMDDGLIDCFWLFWMYVVFLGNYVDSEGIGFSLVSVFISFGGMFMFVMMFGFVFDVIFEKFDLLSKGSSEVVE